MAKIFSVSIPNKQIELIRWLEEKEKLGCKINYSSIFQEALNEIKNEEELELGASNKALRRKLESMKKIFERQRDFIEEKKLMEEFFIYDCQMDEREKKLKKLKEESEPIT
jgi:hypothetical protein